MAEQSAAVQYFLPATIGMIHLALGLGLTRADFARVAEQPRAVLAGAGAQLLGLPLLGFATAALFGLDPTLAVGMVLISACPGGAHSNLFSALARADAALSVTLTAVSGVITVVSIPLWMALAASVFGEGEAVQLGVLETMGQIVAVLLVPLLIGMFVRDRSERLAAVLERVFKTVAVLLLLVIVAGSVARQADKVVDHAKAVGAAVSVLHLLGMGGGFALALGLGLTRRQQVAISLEVGVQNSALAVGMAISLLGSTAVAVPAIVYSLLVYPTSTVLVLWARYSYLSTTEEPV